MADRLCSDVTWLNDLSDIACRLIIGMLGFIVIIDLCHRSFALLLILWFFSWVCCSFDLFVLFFPF